MALSTNYKRIGIKNDTIMQIRIAQSFLKYNVSSVKELEKHHINVLSEILKGLHYDINKLKKG